MSAKNRDERNRWRNLTIAFRVSPEENESINLRVKLSGLTKQDYISRRCQERDIVVVGNPRVYKALKTQLSDVLAVLLQMERDTEIPELLIESIQIIALTLNGLQQDNKEEMKK